MKARLRSGMQIPLIFFLLFSLWFSSCRTMRELPTVEVKSISTAKLIREVELNVFDYKDFSIKRISCQYSSDEKKANFRINLKAVYNKLILVSISKLNIPVGRVLLTPDSVKYVNYMDKNYFLDDYSYLSKILNIDLDFYTIQSIIANNAFSYGEETKDKTFKTYKSYIEDGQYVLQSEKERKISKIEDNAVKAERRMKRLEGNAMIVQKMYFNPGNFVLTRLIIDDLTDNRKMEMQFDDFVQVNKKEYPGSINMNFESQTNNVILKVKMSGFSTEKTESINFIIPEKYEFVKVD